MLTSYRHITRLTGLLVLTATCFCILFGQGTHFHDLEIHISSHLDVHAHVHAHASHDEPMSADHNKKDDTHRHEVSTASDIIATLTSPYELMPDMRPFGVLAMDAVAVRTAVSPGLQQSPTLLDLPPPRPLPIQYHRSPFSRRGPPIS